MKDTNSQGKSFQERLAEAEERRKNATISDIITAKLREADSIEQSARGMFKVGYSWDDLPFTEGDLERELDNAARIRKEAGRLEAALKRERGNCAKMREALERVLCWLKRMNAQPLNTLAISELTPSHAVNRTAKSIIEDNDYHISQLAAALAAPPRNCDRPECATTKAAQDVWRKEDGGKTAYYEWLLATATEKEGVNNANE